MNSQSKYTQGMEFLVDVVQKLSLAKTLEQVIEITRHAARVLTGSDGATFVLREQDKCYYVDEDAIGPLWKGSKFPIQSCISGWSMLNKKSVAIEDIFTDLRIPIDAYKVTFVKSLLIVPIRADNPIGAIGNYWAKKHIATAEEQKLLEALASSTSIALENIQLYKDLKLANAHLAESLQARDEFFKIASHELRTPMSSLTLELQMADRKVKKILDQESPLRHSLEQVKKLNSEIDALFDVTQIRSGNVDIKFSMVNISELLQDEIKRMTSDFEIAACKISASIEPNLNVECDAQKFRQIIRNLFSNAIRHATGCDITITAKSINGYLHFAVEDSGLGIPPEILEKLLIHFERGHTPRRLGGLGLGLFIVRSYVEAHHGTFSIRSLSNGACVTAIMPVRQEVKELRSASL